MDSNDDLIKALQTIQVVFNALQIRYFIGGSVASSYHGAMRSTVQRRSAFNLIHLPTSFKVDIFVSRGRRFDKSAFSRADSCQLGTPENCIDVPIASVEDILLAKLD